MAVNMEETLRHVTSSIVPFDEIDGNPEGEWCDRIGAHIELCCIRRAVLDDSVASALGIPIDRFRLQLDGKHCLSIDELERIATYFEYSDLDQFLRDAIENFPVDPEKRRALLRELGTKPEIPPFD